MLDLYLKFGVVAFEQFDAVEHGLDDIVDIVFRELIHQY